MAKVNETLNTVGSGGNIKEETDRSEVLHVKRVLPRMHLGCFPAILFGEYIRNANSFSSSWLSKKSRQHCYTTIKCFSASGINDLGVTCCSECLHFIFILWHRIPRISLWAPLSTFAIAILSAFCEVFICWLGCLFTF